VKRLPRAAFDPKRKLRLLRCAEIRIRGFRASLAGGGHAIASGVVAHTGTYTVVEATKIHVNIETSSYSKLFGAPNQRWIVTSITDDELKLTNPRTPAGVTLVLVFKRGTYARR